MLKTLNLMALRRAGLAAAAAMLALSFGGCKDASEPAPESDATYYPVAVGNFWVYAVADTTWSPATQTTPSTAKASAYQFRETITDAFTDAAGQRAYRLVRSRRDAPTAAFHDDSVFVLGATSRFVTLNRNNARTVELIFPVREGRSWNFNAFNNNFNDTITAETRRYARVGQPFTAKAAGAPAQTYATTLTTTNTGTAAENSLLKRSGYQQVFAKGVGPVYRRRDNFLNFNYTDSKGNQVYVAGSYSSAFSRRETLIDYGPR